MPSWAKWLWGGMGWAMFGPIGAIMGYALGSMSEIIMTFIVIIKVIEKVDLLKQGILG